MPAEKPTSEQPSVLRVVALASGSSGNAVLVTDGETTVLVDAGISAREVFRRAELCGVDASTISAVIVTHEHTDHTRGVRVLVKRTGARVFASHGTREAARLDDIAPDVRTLRPGSGTGLGALFVTAFATEHDAAEPIGVRIDSELGSFGMFTDSGVFTEDAAEALDGCDIIGIETNHDAQMLQTGPYPYFLKQRIRSAVGHLGNDQAADALERLAHDGLRHVLAMHVSRTNNTFDLACAALADRLERLGLDVPVASARHDRPCEAHCRVTIPEVAT